MPDMPSNQDKVWIRLWKENSMDLRERVVGWRKQNAITRIEKPSRLQRARRLGYKAKQGIIVVRMRVGTGGMRKQRPTGGRRPKHLGVTRIKADDNMKTVADRRVLERYPNMKLLGSYAYTVGKNIIKLVAKIVNNMAFLIIIIFYQNGSIKISNQYWRILFNN